MSPGAANRVMQWIAWKYRIEGELYYSMNEAYGAEQRSMGERFSLWRKRRRDLVLSGTSGPHRRAQRHPHRKHPAEADPGGHGRLRVPGSARQAGRPKGRRRICRSNRDRSPIFGNRSRRSFSRCGRSWARRWIGRRPGPGKDNVMRQRRHQPNGLGSQGATARSLELLVLPFLKNPRRPGANC